MLAFYYFMIKNEKPLDSSKPFVWLNYKSADSTGVWLEFSKKL